MTQENKNKFNVDEMKGLLDNVENLPPPKGVSPEIISAVKSSPIGQVDNKFYGYEELAKEVLDMPVIPKIQFGLEELDEQMEGGLEPGELAIVMGWTKQGKSLVSQTVSYLQSIQKIPSLWFTLEMPWSQLTKRFMAMDDSYRETNNISSLPIFYSKNNKVFSLKWIEEQIIKAREEKGVKVVYIDHLHFLLSLSDNQSNLPFVIGGIVRELKQIATRTNVAIVLMAHTKKIDASTPPDVSSVRDASFIVQESDFTLIIWREPVKQKKNADPMANDQLFTGRVILTLSLNRRNGNTKKIALGMLNGRFHPYAEYLDMIRDQELKEAESHAGDNNEHLKELIKDKEIEKTLFG